MPPCSLWWRKYAFSVSDRLFGGSVCLDFPNQRDGEGPDGSRFAGSGGVRDADGYGRETNGHFRTPEFKFAPAPIVATGVDSALTGMPAQRPNQVLPDPLPAVQDVNLWINPQAFASPAPGTYGNLGINNILGPGSIRIDMGLTRMFHIREKQTIQFRWEAFNLPNHANLGNPITAMNNVNFGKILSTATGSLGDPRILQAALKYVF